MVQKQQLTASVFVKRDKPQVRRRNLPLPEDISPVKAESPDLAGVVVTVDIGANKFGEAGTAIDVTACQRPGLGVAVFGDRRQNGCGPAISRWLVRVASLHDIPAVIAAALDEVNHFPEVLPDVAGPQLAG